MHYCYSLHFTREGTFQDAIVDGQGFCLQNPLPLQPCFWEVREMGVRKHYLLTFEVESIEETFNESILSNALI